MKKKGLGFAMPAALALFPSGVFYPSSPAARSNPEAGDNATPATTVAGIVRTVQEVPVPGTTVRVVHVASGRSMVSWTASDGKFSYRGLPASRYRDFLDLPYNDAMLRFHKGRTKADPDLDGMSAWRPITPGLRDRRSQMPGEDMERFEAAAGDLLDELGYPRAVLRPRPEGLEHASKIRHSFTMQTGTRSFRVVRLRDPSPGRESLTRGSKI